MPLSPSHWSRFRETGTIFQDGEEVYGVWTLPAVLTQELRSDQVSLRVIRNDLAGRPDLISYQEYGTSELDWLLLAFNNVRDVMNWPKSGEVIRIPARSLVFASF